MAVRNRLVLDHFYIGLDDDAFEKLLPLTQLFKNCEHSKVTSGAESWEGIYLQSRTGAYFEIVRDREVHGLGLALSAAKPQYTDTRKIVEELPELPWKTGTRVDEGGAPWFDWITLSDYLDIHATFFNAWIMNYRFNHRDSSHTVSPCSVDRFKEIHLDLGRDNVSEVERLSSWLPGTREIKENLIQFELPDREGSSFIVFIHLVDGKSQFRFKSLDLALAHGQNVESKKLGTFLLEQHGDAIRLLSRI